MGDGRQAAVIDRFAFVPHYIVLLANALTAGASRTYFREIGLGINESRILSVLGHTPGLTRLGMAGAMAMNKSIVSRSLQTLIAAGHVRSEGTARTGRFFLTAAGRDHHDTIVRLSMVRQERLLHGLDAADRRRLIELLARLLENIPAVNADVAEDDQPPAAA